MVPALAAPTGVTATTLSGTKIRVNWNSVPGATGYSIYRSLTVGGTYTAVHHINTGATTSYVNGGLNQTTTYFYVVRTRQGVDISRAVVPTGVGHEALALPAAPTGVTATALSGTQIRVNWNTVPGATGYTIYRSLTKNGTYATLYHANNGATTSYVNGGLSPGTTYFYVVRARNAAGISAPSSPPASATTQEPLPAAPTGVTATALSGISIQVNWNTVPGATGYSIYRSLTVDGTYTAVHHINTGSTTVSQWGSEPDHDLLLRRASPERRWHLRALVPAGLGHDTRATGRPDRGDRPPRCRAPRSG